MTDFDTLSEAMNAMHQEGYTFDFNLGYNSLGCEELNTDFGVDEFHVDSFYRFEGASDPDDSSILFAITTTNGVKGLLVDAYGVYAEAISEEMLDKLKMG